MSSSLLTSSSSSSSSSSSGEEPPEPTWSISVKIVGAEEQPQQPQNRNYKDDNNDLDDAVAIPSCFQVQVKPSDNIQSLHDHIETVTGLSPNQQRLIYRGRIIQTDNKTVLPANNNSNNNHEEQQQQDEQQHRQRQRQRHQADSIPTKIKEIKGMGDGQTIHLVRRPDTTTPAALKEQEESSSLSNNVNINVNEPISTGSRNNSNSNSNNASLFDSGGGGGNATGSLLAALLGLSALDEEVSDEGRAGNANANAAGNPLQSWRRRSSHNRNNFRLTAEDLQVPDPGSMESVRQGLLTLHTLLPVAQRQHQPGGSSGAAAATTTATIISSPLDHHRQWFLGQWIDCRDTVNQWLEATIVAIVRPDEVLPGSTPRRSTARTSSTSPTLQPAMDPAVGASDLEGRRRLLIEACDEGIEGDGGPDPDDLGGELEGYRRRDAVGDPEVLLLLIHYNGWPHRWDEWIRSDSERIRPFRTRTRHNTNSPHISPTTVSHYADSPSTSFIHGQTDAQDRAYLLQELVHVTAAVQTLAEQAAQALPPPPSPPPPPRHQQHATGGGTDDYYNNDLPWGRHGRNNGGAAPRAAGVANPRQCLELLAPLLDRLGRTLVDAAPHIASLAASCPASDASSSSSSAGSDQPNPDSAAHQEEGSEADGEQEETSDRDTAPANHNSSVHVHSNPNSLGGLLSLLNRDRRRNSRTSQSQLTDQALTHVSGDGTTAVVVDPDYTDFATGLVNTSRGDVRAGPRSSRRNGSTGGSTSSTGDDLGGLLGAYLAAASLGGLVSASSTGDGDDTGGGGGAFGRLLRAGANGEGGGGGIDVHIHAVITTPGGGALGLGGIGAGLGGALGIAMAQPHDVFANTRRATAQRVRATLLEQVNDEDSGIFDDLYSENPDPVSSTLAATRTRARATPADGDDNAVGEMARFSFAPLASSTSSLAAASSPASQRNSRQNNNNSNRSGSFLGRLFRRSGGGGGSSASD